MKYMRKIIAASFLSLICLPVLTIANTTPSIKTSEDCKLRGFNLLAYDSNFKGMFDFKLMEFGGMKSTDFDVDGCIGENNVANGILTAEYAQNKNKIVGQHLKSFVAFDPKNNEILVALIDEESKSYIIGNRTPNLISALNSSFSSNDNFKKIDLTSTLTFLNFNEITEPEKFNFEQSQAIEKRIEENKRLFSIASANLKKSNSKDLIYKNSTYQGLLKDGESKNSKITITAILDKNINVPLSKKDISHNLYFISDLAKIGLKNPYSFRPRSAFVKQEGILLKVSIEYTAQNSYGADVVGNEYKILFLGKDGNYHTER